MTPAGRQLLASQLSAFSAIALGDSTFDVTPAEEESELLRSQLVELTDKYEVACQRLEEEKAESLGTLAVAMREQLQLEQARREDTEQTHEALQNQIAAMQQALDEAEARCMCNWL